VDVLGDSAEANPAELFRLMANPTLAEAALRDWGPGLFERKYREFVRLPSARSAYGRLFADLARVERRPALFHCTTGKDRTGWAAAALLLLLEVPEDAVLDDFLLSNERIGSETQPMLDRFADAGGDPELLRPLAGVRASYLASALDEMRAGYGTIEGYFADGLGVDAATQLHLRSELVARG
jgi:protein-tyrosine phosphatase